MMSYLKKFGLIKCKIIALAPRNANPIATFLTIFFASDAAH
jgi:hypothetical protein